MHAMRSMLALLVLLIALPVSAQTVNVAWDAPVADPTKPVDGYIVQIGQSSGSTSTEQNVGNTLAATVGVVSGDNYIRVRAYNAAGTGPASNEVTYTYTPTQTCSFSGWTLAAADTGAWGTCTETSPGIWTQTRSELWRRTVLTGGSSCGPLTDPRTGSQTCTPPTDVCTTTPLTITIRAWPVAKKTIIQFTSNQPAVTYVVIKDSRGRVIGATFTDQRGCTTTVMK